MNTSDMAFERWRLEFARVVRCEKCSSETDPNLLRDCGENVPQPGYIGVGYQRSKLLLVGQNPAVPPAKLELADKGYTAAL